MIRYTKKFIRIVECWDGEVPDSNGADLTRRFQQRQPLEGMLCREFYTVLIDLTQNTEQIFANMKRGTRYEIRRAVTRDQFVYRHNDVGELDEFCAYADTFLAERKQPALNRRWLELLAEAELLRLTRMDDEFGKPLVWHAYHVSRHRATLLYSASLFRLFTTQEFRAQVGRANRFHHWQDMLRFKETGIATYDFGGWYEGTKDLERLRINKFKEQFGGEIVRNYICEQALTLKGALFLRLRSSLLGNAI